MLNRVLTSILLMCFVAVLATGCGGSDPEAMIAQANDMNVKRLATVYSFFHLKNNFKGPKDEAELKKFISAQDASRMALADIDVNDVDSLFTGERDNLPLKIRYGINTKVRGPSLAVVFEDTGVDGLRQVGFTNGSTQEVASEEYDKLWSGKTDKSAPPATRE